MSCNSLRSPHLACFGSRTLGLGALAYLVVLVVHGALPGLATPTLGQALWTLGFAQSFINESLLSLHATHFGYPEPAAIAFGLAGAVPTGWWLALGLSPADAFSAMIAGWLAVAYGGALWLSRRLGASPVMAVLAAMAWLTLPMLWWHMQYSMLALGMALLPTYHASVVRLCDTLEGPIRQRLIAAAGYLAAATVAIFMDGYTFMMFACGSSLLLLANAYRHPARRRLMLKRLLGWHVLAFGLAYGLFSAYIGRGQYEAAALDFFRGWGVDLTYLAWPSEGIHWLWDWLGVSVERDNARHFGDASVWSTTFLLPLIVLGLYGAWLARKHKPVAGLLLVALFGTYMALGPSLKVDSTRPPVDSPPGASMAAEHALAPTGSAVISRHLPGFNNMRAAYRWGALSAFGLWALMVAGLSRHARLRRGGGQLLFLLLVVANWPAEGRWSATTGYRDSIGDIDATLVASLGRDLSAGERVAFLPYRNDFLVNFLAARSGIHAFNIGGDKNLAIAREHWPAILNSFPVGKLGTDYATRMQVALAGGEVDAIVMSYLDTLWAAHIWPAPPVLKDALLPAVNALADLDTLEVTRRDDYAVVRLADGFRSASAAGQLHQRLIDDHCLPPWCHQASPLSRHQDLVSEVGEWRDGRLQTTGRAGWLFYGHYADLAAGRYRLQLTGTERAPGDAHLEVVSGRGRVVHDRFPLAPPSEPHPGVLLDVPVELATAARELEIRLRVDAASDLGIDGYRLRKEVPASRH